MDTKTIGYINNRKIHYHLNPKVKTLAQEIPQPQIAKSGLESLRLALFLFSFLRICYWPLSLLDSSRKDGSEPAKQLRAFLGKEPNAHAGGETNAGWTLPGSAVPSPATGRANPRKPQKSPGPLLLQPPLVLGVSTLAKAGGKVTKFRNFVASGVASVQKQSTGETRQPLSQQEGLAIGKEVLTKLHVHPRLCFPPEKEGSDLFCKHTSSQHPMTDHKYHGAETSSSQSVKTFLQQSLRTDWWMSACAGHLLRCSGDSQSGTGKETCGEFSTRGAFSPTGHEQVKHRGH